MPKWARSCFVRRVSSAAIRPDSRRVRRARRLISSRLPMGVATRNSVPMQSLYGIESKNGDAPRSWSARLVVLSEIHHYRVLGAVAIGADGVNIRQRRAGVIAQLDLVCVGRVDWMVGDRNLIAAG